MVNKFGLIAFKYDSFQCAFRVLKIVSIHEAEPSHYAHSLVHVWLYLHKVIRVINTEVVAAVA